MPFASSSAHVLTVPAEDDDVPGSRFEKEPAEYTVEQLKRWLKCRGLTNWLTTTYSSVVLLHWRHPASLANDMHFNLFTNCWTLQAVQFFGGILFVVILKVIPLK